MNTTTNILATLSHELSARDTAITALTARRDTLEAENAALRARLIQIDNLAGGTPPPVVNAGVNGWPIHGDAQHQGGAVYRLSTPILAADAPLPVTIEVGGTGRTYSWVALIPAPATNP